MRKIDENRLYAVITGDIVASSRLAKDRRTHHFEYMEMGFEALREAFGKDTLMAADVASGDRWQMLLREPHKALRVALFYRAFLRARMESHNFHSRVAIGIGSVIYVPRSSLTKGDGEAFHLSGRALDRMRGHVPSDGTMRLEFPQLEKANELNVLLVLLEELASRWTDRQALAMTGALQGWTQERIAENWWSKKITQQAVAQHLARAGWYAIEEAIRYSEDVLSMATAQNK